MVQPLAKSEQAMAAADVGDRDAHQPHGRGGGRCQQGLRPSRVSKGRQRPGGIWLPCTRACSGGMCPSRTRGAVAGEAYACCWRPRKARYTVVETGRERGGDEEGREVARFLYPGEADLGAGLKLIREWPAPRRRSSHQQSTNHPCEGRSSRCMPPRV